MDLEDREKDKNDSKVLPWRLNQRIEGLIEIRKIRG